MRANANRPFAYISILATNIGAKHNPVTPTTRNFGQNIQTVQLKVNIESKYVTFHQKKTHISMGWPNMCQSGSSQLTKIPSKCLKCAKYGQSNGAHFIGKFMNRKDIGIYYLSDMPNRLKV